MTNSKPHARKKKGKRRSHPRKMNTLREHAQYRVDIDLNQANIVKL